MKKLLLFIFLTCNSVIFGQNCNCDSLFTESQKIVEDNYAGWFDKVNSSNQLAYDEWTTQKYLQAQKITEDSLCSNQIKEWLSFFKDKHLRIRYNKPKSNSNDQLESKEIKILSTNFSESQIIDYLSTTKKLDPIEGIYESSSYKLGITQVEPNVFYATIITTQNENWKVGEVKLVIKKNGDNYEGTFYEGDKSDLSLHKVQLVDNLLDFDILFFEKILPAPSAKIDVTEYEMSKDRYAPSLSFRDSIAIWKFPSFENNSYEQTAYLLEKYKDTLKNIPYWVLDLTNNSGGDYSIGLQLLDYIYTDPLVFYNSEMRLTKSNYEIWYNSYISNYYENLDSIGKSKLDVRLNKMKANYGTMYNDGDKLTDTLKMEVIKPYPKKIALLINENTVSSGELFTMIARQSAKVKVMGANSGGMMDYGNIVNYKTICSTMRLQIPTDRQLWLETGFSVDKEGLKPNFYLAGENWVDQAINIIKQ